MLLGAAQILKSMEGRLSGTVKLMFQPGEETGAGARLMVEDGILSDPKVDAAFGLHVQPTDTTGQIGYATGVNSASLDTFILKIHGKGGHSSQPQLCVDPLMIMNQVYQAVNLLTTREADPAAMVALTCGVAKGGTAVNIIPNEAELHIGLRTLNVEAAEHLKKRIPELIDHYVKAWNADYDLTVFHTPCTQTDETLCRQLVPHIEEITGSDCVHEIPAMTGTEDFGYVTKEVPGMFAFIGAGSPGNAPLHSPHMILDENVLPLGALFMPTWQLPGWNRIKKSRTFLERKNNEPENRKKAGISYASCIYHTAADHAVYRNTFLRDPPAVPMSGLLTASPASRSSIPTPFNM